MLGYVFNLATSFTRTQMAPKSKFKTIYWYGERYYCAAEVDAHINTSGTVTESNPQPLATVPCMRIDPSCMHVKSSELFSRAYSCSIAAKETKSNSSLMDENENMESGSVSATDYWNAIANDGTLALSSPTTCSPSHCISPFPSKPEVVTTHSEPADSPHSVTSSTSAGCGGSRGRAIGKRNQEFYLPEGGVRLSHVSTGCQGGECEAWFGRYDKKSNTIGRTPDADTDTVIATYETLAHFAQEHDREAHHSETKDTPNVWKNHLFTFYNTVTCEWEPLSSLRE